MSLTAMETATANQETKLAAAKETLVAVDSRCPPPTIGVRDRSKGDSNAATIGIGGESSVVKQRLRWTPELHTLFMEACTRLGGLDFATCKGIIQQLALVGCRGKNNQQVKSHLQKQRLHTGGLRPNAMSEFGAGGQRRQQRNGRHLWGRHWQCWW